MEFPQSRSVYVGVDFDDLFGEGLREQLDYVHVVPSLFFICRLIGNEPFVGSFQLDRAESCH